MKKDWLYNLMDDLPGKTVDSRALTLQEMAAKPGQSYWKVKVFARIMVNSGRWERVWKLVDKKLVPAFRRKRS